MENRTTETNTKPIGDQNADLYCEIFNAIMRKAKNAIDREDYAEAQRMLDLARSMPSLY